MGKKSAYLIACFLIVVLTACGGTKEWKPGNGDGDDDTHNQLTDSPCAAGALGTDSDHDGLTDECEILIGTDPFDGDTTDNGIGDALDDPSTVTRPDGTALPCGEDCENARQSLLQRILAAIAPSIYLGRNAFRQTGTARVEKQFLVMGPLDQVPSQVWADDSGLGHPPRLSFFPPPEPEDPRGLQGQGNNPCNDANNIFFFAKGQVKPDGSTWTDATIEFCGKLQPTGPINSNETTILNGTQILEWTVASTSSEYFKPYYKESPGAQTTEAFEELIIEEPQMVEEETIFTELKFDLHIDMEFWDMNESGQFVNIESDEIKRAWKRTGNLANQVGHFPGFSGLWTSACVGLDCWL